MCDFNTKRTELGGGKFSLDIRCEKTGLPITETGPYGMFCRKKCGIGKDKFAKLILENLFKALAVAADFRDKLKRR